MHGKCYRLPFIFTPATRRRSKAFGFDFLTKNLSLSLAPPLSPKLVSASLPHFVCFIFNKKFPPLLWEFLSLLRIFNKVSSICLFLILRDSKLLRNPKCPAFSFIFYPLEKNPPKPVSVKAKYKPQTLNMLFIWSFLLDKKITTLYNKFTSIDVFSSQGAKSQKLASSAEVKNGRVGTMRGHSFCQTC